MEQTQSGQPKERHSAIVCEHGSLRRQCPHCEFNDALDAMKRSKDALVEALIATDDDMRYQHVQRAKEILEKWIQ